MQQPVLDIDLGARLRASALLSSTHLHSAAPPLRRRGPFLPNGSCWEEICTHTHLGILHWDVTAWAQALPEPSQKEASGSHSSLSLLLLFVSASLCCLVSAGRWLLMNRCNEAMSPRRASQRQSCSFPYSGISFQHFTSRS